MSFALFSLLTAANGTLLVVGLLVTPRFDVLAIAVNTFAMILCGLCAFQGMDKR